MRDQSTAQLRCATLQHVLDALTEMFVVGEIDDVTLRQARSSILSYCRAAGRTPAQCKADIVELLERADESSALRAGMFPERWTKVKSMLRRTLNLVGNPTKAARRNRPLSPMWDRMLRESGNKDIQARLRPLAGYCTDHQIDPPKVNEAVLKAYAEEARQIAKSKNLPDALAKLRRSWNKLVDVFPAELTFRAETWTKSRRWAKKVEVMPKPFQDEIALLRKARSPATFEEAFKCRPLKHDKAVDDFIATIMRIATAMLMNGHPISKFTSLRYLVQPDYFKETILRLKEQSGTDDLRNLGVYVAVIHWLAETWVKLGTAKMKQLKASMAVVGRRKAEIADSSLDVLEQIDDPVRRKAVLDLCETIYQEFRSRGHNATRKNAEAYRNILFFELGLTTGWRPSSRARVNAKDDIKWNGRKGKEIATLTAGKVTEKTELRRKVELPPATSQMLLYFINHAAPLLRAPGDHDNPFLFPSRNHGQHTSLGELSRQSKKLIARRTCVVGVTGHKSRHVSVKLHLEQNRDDWSTAQEHIGHRNPETTKTFYANVTQVESSKRVQRSLGKR